MKYRNVLWDWNGTLLDDTQCAVDCVNDILNDLGLPLTDINQYYEMMELPIERYYAKLIDLDKHGFDDIARRFQQSYAKRFNGLKIMDGAVEVLERFKKDGAHQYLVSSFENSRLLEYTSKLEIDGYFEEISGSEDIFCGSKISRAKEIMRRISGSTVYIGDTVADYETARNIGVDCLLVANGHQKKSDLLRCGVTVIDSIGQINFD